MTDDTDKTTTSPDAQFPTDSSASVNGRGGIGRTTRSVELFRHAVQEMNRETGWFDPKGDPDAQNDDDLPTEYIESDSQW